MALLKRGAGEVEAREDIGGCRSADAPTFHDFHSCLTKEHVGSRSIHHAIEVDGTAGRWYGMWIEFEGWRQAPKDASFYPIRPWRVPCLCKAVPGVGNVTSRSWLIKTCLTHLLVAADHMPRGLKDLSLNRLTHLGDIRLASIPAGKPLRYSVRNGSSMFATQGYLGYLGWRSLCRVEAPRTS